LPVTSVTPEKPLIEITAMLERWMSGLGELEVRTDAVVHRLPELLIGTPVVMVGKVVDAMEFRFRQPIMSLLYWKEGVFWCSPVQGGSGSEFSWHKRNWNY
jgi:hypothetical protein